MTDIWRFLSRAAAIVALIARSKLVPDFALTMHALHLVFTALYTRSLPRHALWYAAMLASASCSPSSSAAAGSSGTTPPRGPAAPAPAAATRSRGSSRTGPGTGTGGAGRGVKGRSTRWIS